MIFVELLVAILRGPKLNVYQNLERKLTVYDCWDDVVCIVTSIGAG